jgi:hypothetical protein
MKQEMLQLVKGAEATHVAAMPDEKEIKELEDMLDDLL